MQYPFTNTAMSFDGSSSCESDSNIGKRVNGSEPFTLDAWVYITDFHTKKSIARQEGVFDFGVNGDKVYFSMNGYPTITSSRNNGFVECNKCCHIAVAYNTSNIYLYINGVYNISASVSGCGTTNNNPWVFGNLLNGYIRQVRVFNTALEKDQILLYLMMTDLSDALFKSLLTVYYDFARFPSLEHIKNMPIRSKGNATPICYSNAAIFSGNSYVSIEDSPLMNPAGKGNDSYTVQAWVFLKPDNYAQRYTIFANGDIYNAAGMSLYLEKQGDIYKAKTLRGSTNQSDDILESKVNVLPNKWVNIAVTYNIDALRIYVNGSLDNIIKGLFPIASTMDTPHLHIGSEVVDNNINGIDWFSGFISRMDVWERALTDDEIRNYASDIPLVDSKALQASYNFQVNANYNACSGIMIGEINNLRLTEIFYAFPKSDYNESAAFNENQTESTPREPLSWDILNKCRSYALSDEHDKCFQEMCKKHSDMLQSIPLQQKAFFTVTSHSIEGTLYFVAHEEHESYTMCFMNDVAMSDMDKWWLELFLIILGGLIMIVCGLRIRANTTLLSKLTKLRNIPRIVTLFTGQITLTHIISFIKITYASGLLIDIIRSALSGFSFWKVAWAITSFVALAVAAAFGGWVYYAVAIGVLIVEVIYHLTKIPVPTPPIALASICFNHQDTTIYKVPITITLRDDNRDIVIQAPEWTSNQSSAPSYVAYRTDNCNQDIIIKATFASSNLSKFTSKVRCLTKSTENLFGESTTVDITMSNGTPTIIPMSFVFKNHKLRSGNVGVAELKLCWQYLDSKTGNWVNMSETCHKVYSVLSAPNYPWASTVEGGSLQLQYPWVSALEFSCKWANGKKDKTEAAKAVTEAVNGTLGLRYDVNKGASYYTNWSIDEGEFFLLQFLNQLRNKKGSAVVNCTDCATIVATFANAIGCQLSEKIMGWSFACNKILAIGTVDWKIPFNSGFGYHEVAMFEPLSAGVSPVVENNYKVYDACLLLNGSTTPDKDAGRMPYLPVEMDFSQYGDVTSVPSIPEKKSYREHLAINNSKGVGQCRYDEDYNNKLRRAYKRVSRQA